VQRPAAEDESKKENKSKKEQKELDATVQKFVVILQNGDTEGFLGIASHEGISFGIDSDPIPFRKIESQIHQKRGVYCFLFDTACLRREELQEWKKAKHSGNIKGIISLREALQSASSKKINVSPEGWVSWKLGLEGNPAADIINGTTLGFALEHGDWKLGEVQYP
jgi:hypothetical protein